MTEGHFGAILQCFASEIRQKSGWNSPAKRRARRRSKSVERVESIRSAMRKLFDRHANDAGSHHAQRPSRADRQIDHPSPNEGTTVVDATLDRAAFVAHGHDASKRPGSVGARHSMTAAPIIGSQTGFGFGRCDEKGEKSSQGQERGSIHRGFSHVRDPCPLSL